MGKLNTDIMSNTLDSLDLLADLECCQSPALCHEHKHLFVTVVEEGFDVSLLRSVGVYGALDCVD